MQVDIVKLEKPPRGWKPIETRYVTIGNQNPLEVAANESEALGKEIAIKRGYDPNLVHRFGAYTEIENTSIPYSNRVIGVNVSLYSI